MAEEYKLGEGLFLVVTETGLWRESSSHLEVGSRGVGIPAQEGETAPWTALSPTFGMRFENLPNQLFFVAGKSVCNYLS